LDNLIRDFRFAIRQMARNPGFAATADLVLGLGMGVSAAIFAFVVSGTDQGILILRAKSPVLAFCKRVFRRLAILGLDPRTHEGRQPGPAGKIKMLVEHFPLERARRTTCCTTARFRDVPSLCRTGKSG